jgi:hypothetical protein
MSGLSDLLKRKMPKKAEAKYPSINRRGGILLTVSMGILATISQFTKNPQHKTKPITKL